MGFLEFLFGNTDSIREAALEEAQTMVPDLGCPECAWREFVPVREVIAVRANGQRRTTGSVVHCAKCASQFVVSVAGVYKTSPVAPPQATAERARPPAPAERALRDPDMAGVWEGRRQP